MVEPLAHSYDPFIDNVSLYVGEEEHRLSVSIPHKQLLLFTPQYNSHWVRNYSVLLLSPVKMMGAFPMNFSERGWACCSSLPPPCPCGSPPPLPPLKSSSSSSLSGASPLCKLRMGLSAEGGSPMFGAMAQWMAASLSVKQCPVAGLIGGSMMVSCAV